MTSTIIWGGSNGFDVQNKTSLPETNSDGTFDIEFLDVDRDGDLDIIEGRYYAPNTGYDSHYLNNQKMVKD